MNRKLLAVALTCMLMLAVSSNALADGLLPISSTKKTDRVTMISFGVTNGLTPYSTVTLEDGSVTETYLNAYARYFEAFSERLASDGSYEVVNYQVEVEPYTYEISKDGLILKLTYAPSTCKLTANYPAGVMIEKKNPFLGYTRIELGDEIKLPGYGRLKISRFEMHEPFVEKYVYFDYGDAVAKSHMVTRQRDPKYGFWVTGEFQNLTNKSILYMDLFGESFRKLPEMTLHYITEDGHYTYKNHYTSEYEGNNVLYIGKLNKTASGRKYGNSDKPNQLSEETPRVDSLCTGHWGLYFEDVPQSVYQAGDGMLALTFTFKDDGTQYVLIIRE